MTYNWFLGPGTYVGDSYAPDEMAKGLVSELKLRDGDTVSKDQIVDYLAKHGLSPTWAAETAMTLRNMFGVTPIFFESFAGDGLISEMTSMLGHDERDSDITESDLSIIYGIAIEEAFAASDNDVDDAVVAALSMETLETVSAIASLDKWLTEAQLAQFENVYDAGGDALVEHWYDAVTRPHMIRFMNDNIVHSISEALGCDPGDLADVLSEDMSEPGERRSPMNPRKLAANKEREMRAKASAKARDVAPDKMDRAVKSGVAAMNREDPLAARASNPDNLAHRYHSDKVAGGMHNLFKGKAQSSGEGERQFAHKQLSNAKRSMQNAKPLPLPSHEPPSPGIAKQALSAVGRVANSVGSTVKSGVGRVADIAKDKLHKMGQSVANHNVSGKRLPDAAPSSAQAAQPQAAPSHPPDHDSSGLSSEHPEPEQKPSLASRVIKGAKRVAGGVLGGVMGGLAGAHSGHGLVGRTAGFVRGAVGGAIRGTQAGGVGAMAGNIKHMLRARARIKAPGLMYALHGAPGHDELQAATHLGLHNHYARMGYDLNKVHGGQRSQQSPEQGQVKQPGQRRRGVEPAPAFRGESVKDVIPSGQTRAQHDKNVDASQPYIGKDKIEPYEKANKKQYMDKKLNQIKNVEQKLSKIAGKPVDKAYPNLFVDLARERARNS